MGDKVLVSQNQSQVEVRTKSTVVDAGFDPQAISTTFQRQLRNHRYTEAALKADAHNFALDFAFGYAEYVLKTPVFGLEWEKNDGEIFVGELSFLKLVKPSEDQLRSYQEKGIPYTPLPDEVVQDLMETRQKLLNGEVIASVPTLGCDGRNYVQVFLPNSTCYLIEHLGDREELRVFHDRIVNNITTAYNNRQAQLVDWPEVLSAAQDSLSADPTRRQRDWLERLQQHIRDPQARQELILQVADKIEELVLKRLLPLLKTGDLDNRLDDELLGLRPEVEKLLSSQLQGRITPSPSQKSAIAVPENDRFLVSALDRGVEPTSLATWHAVETDRSVRAAARGVRSQLSERLDLEKYGLWEKLDALLRNGASLEVSSGPVCDPTQIATLCRTVAAFTNDPEFSSDLYMLADMLERAAKRAWRAVREGEIPVPRNIRVAEPAPPVAIGEHSRTGAWSSDLQKLLDAMTQEEERREVERHKLRVQEASRVLLGKASRNPFLAALRNELAVPEGIVEILAHPAFRSELETVAAQTTQPLPALKAPLTQSVLPVEAEESMFGYGLKNQRAHILEQLEGRLDGKEDALARVKRKWRPLKDTEVYDIGLIVELIEVLDLPHQEKTAILNAAGVGQPQVTLVERIARQLVIERKFRVVDDPAKSPQAA